MDSTVPLTPSPLPGPGTSSVHSRGFRRPSPSLSAGSSFSASTVANSIGGGVDGTGQRQMLSDRYALGEELGRGAFGQVFKGMDTRSGEAVAIKQMALGGIPAETLAAIMGEIELLRNLHHPNIVEYIGSFKTRSHLYIIMEYMENGALSTVIKPNKFGPFMEPLVSAIIAQVLRGLAYLHEQGVVHRDIKGANILTTKEGLVKLADFGVAARISEGPDGDELSLSVVGTPYWMAPEVIEMTSVSSASDIWSVGCLAIELLTGNPPYSELQPMSAMFRVVQDAHPPLPKGVSHPMHNFLMQCFQKDPHGRSDARALLRHPWIESHRQTLHSTWRDSRASRGAANRSDAHASVATVVEHILQESGSAPTDPPRSVPPSVLPPPPPPPSPAPAAIEPRRSMGSSANGSVQSMPQQQPQQPGSISRTSSMESRKQRPPALQLPPDSDGPLATLIDGLEEGGSGKKSSGRTIPAERPQMTDRQAAAAATSELTAWLAERDRNAPAPRSSVSGSGGADGLKSQDVAEVRQLVAALKVNSAMRLATRERTPTAAAATLADTVRHSPQRKATFLAEDGAVALIELLNSRKPDVVTAALRLANAVAAGDTVSLQALALSGLVPVVGRFAERSYDYTLREQASIFLQHICYTSAACMQLLVACQGLQHLVDLVDDMYSDGGALSDAGVCCIWRVLEAAGAAALNQRCRLLAAAGLPSRLVALCARARADLSAMQDAPRPRLHAGSGARQAEDENGSMQQSPSVSEGLLSPDEMLSTDDYFGRRRSGSASTFAAHGNDLSSFKNRSTSGPPTGRTGGPGSGSTGSKSSTAPADAAAERLSGLMARAADLLLVLSHADSTVKATIARRDTLLALFDLVADVQAEVAVKLLRCVKHLTRDPSMLLPLYDCGTIQLLEPFLRAGQPGPMQLEALSALYNLCKISKVRQEAAAVAHAVPHLTRLALAPAHVNGGAPAVDPAIAKRLRELAVPLLCSMAHSTGRARSALAAADGHAVLLGVLTDRPWQAPALDALATWLVEDTARLEPRLLGRDVTNRFVALLAAYTPCSPDETETLVQLLGPLVRMVRVSPRLAVALGQAGLPALLVRLLHAPTALTALPLLQLLRSVYEHHPRPKEFLARYAVHEELQRLAGSSTQAVLVRKQAQTLLDAFRMNTVF